MVLCCKSEKYFRARIDAVGAAPVLLTTQFMYPGAFILHDVIEEWRKESNVGKIRELAGKSYAKNQKISVKAGCGIFAVLYSQGTAK